MLSGYTRFQFNDYRDQMEYQGDTDHLKCNSDNNRKLYIALYPVKHYELAARYIINIDFQLTVKTAQVM